MNTVISVKLDLSVRDSAREVAQSAGLTLSALINAYLRQVIATRHIELYAPEPMTPKLEKMIGRAEKDIAAGRVSKKFARAKDFLADLKT
ncbi:type II toxin-antitoxin system RelB/DinJ family antitoxin [Candidatus Uhrbacteria bacterium]|nr:type II toxin-antitoxin system RelB/DinJ family antitoxin [Candidatus Uhrbacteria bacterium]